MSQLITITKLNDILPEYQNTPISLLIEFHNLNRPYADYQQAQLLVGMCMDHRKHLHIPENFSYIIRTGGANLRYSEFKVSYAISVGGIKHIALIGHNNCGMVNLNAKKEQFIGGLVKEAGWTMDQAVEHFNNFAPMFEIGNAIDFVVAEAKRLRVKYPKIIVAPLFYNVDDNKLYMIEE
nr:carbonic anhydrase [uncultured Marinifilum sp.]